MPIIQLFFDLCLFRKGPQDAPDSWIVMRFTLGVYALVGLILLGIETVWDEAVLQVALEGAILFGFVWISLKLAGKVNRFVQTTIAMLGADALISSLAIPLVIILKVNSQIPIIHLLLLMLMVWHLVVVAHIFRHALSQTIAIGLALSIVYMVFSYQIMILLFGSPQATS